MVFRECVHCGREYEDVFNRTICSDECFTEIPYSKLQMQSLSR
jgi:hypothetical protein